MTNLGKTILYRANGESKILENRLHAFMTEHPVAAVLVALAVGIVVGRLV